MKNMMIKYGLILNTMIPWYYHGIIPWYLSHDIGIPDNVMMYLSHDNVNPGLINHGLLIRG